MVSAVNVGSRSENTPKLWAYRNGNGNGNGNGSIHHGLMSSSPPGSSPPSSSPPSFSPIASPHPFKTLRRSNSSSVFLLDRRIQSPSPPPIADNRSLLGCIFGSLPVRLFVFLRNLAATVIYLIWSQVFLIGPTLWISCVLWFWCKCISIPLAIVKWILTVMFTSASERARKKRTVLISGGSSIQALHLARNFYSAGARVVVCEVSGLFGLARFSTAVHRFYTLPRPSGERGEEYVEAVRRIVEKEKVSWYIPVSASNTAYYDALLKPQLEAMKCTCFCPGLKEVCTLDDTHEVLKKCRSEGMATPNFYPIACKDDIIRLYENGTLRSGRHYMVSIGVQGCRERIKLNVPNSRKDFRVSHLVTEQRPWLIVQDYPGERFVTCTTVEDSVVVANVTCRVDRADGGLVPLEHAEINQWLQQFFNKLRFLRPITGHISFRFVVSSVSGSIVPVGCRVGVSLPYICYTSVHTRIVWKPCRHFNRQVSGPLVLNSGRYWMHETVFNTIRQPGLLSVVRLLGTVLDKREALFAYWDPLPYCAYYHLQLPFNHLVKFVTGEKRVALGSSRTILQRTMTQPRLQ